MKNIGFKNVFISESATVAGKRESEGPIGKNFDSTDSDPYFGQPSWETGEAEMVRRAINILLAKAGKREDEIGLMTGGDLLNQCTATAFAANTFPFSYLGLYGACSTFAESLIVGGVFVENGYTDNAIALASSHFCTSERQFRFPLEYGCQRPPMSQNTVTGAGAVLLCREKSPVKLTKARVGIVSDKGITDANNMGAAMAASAVDTIIRFFSEGENPDEYDVIATGDLGRKGYEMAKELFIKEGLDLGNRFCDCGMLIYDLNKQDVHSGGSGCGCSACVTGSLFYPKIASGELKKVLLVGTGALLSAKTVQQKLPIPAIGHAVCLEYNK